ncbi:MAG: response regulator [Verrucomicrobia bacterium]|nr:response regulator [Verrucomicrobiota bacterium]
MKSDHPHILLAEDDSADAELTLSAIQGTSLKNRVVRVSDGQETLDYLLRRKAWRTRPSGDPALVLLDLKMPKIGGIEVLQTIRANSKLQSIPVVIFTSSGERRDIAICYQNGANAYVIKPVGFPDFKIAVQSIGRFWSEINVPPPLKSRRLERRSWQI